MKKIFFLSIFTFFLTFLNDLRAQPFNLELTITSQTLEKLYFKVEYSLDSVRANSLVQIVSYDTAQTWGYVEYRQPFGSTDGIYFDSIDISNAPIGYYLIYIKIKDIDTVATLMSSFADFYSITITTTAEYGLQNKKDISIYPNPTQNNFTISGVTTPYQLSLFDITGKTVMTEARNGGDSGDNFSLDLQPGMYYYVVQEGTRQKNGRIAIK